MPVSQNVLFEGECPEDGEFGHPPGLPILRSIAAGLRADGWFVSDFENWRDCGWCLECGRSRPTMRVALASVQNTTWMMQASPARIPGLSRLFGRKPSATPGEVLELARALHTLLRHPGAYTGMRWRWDGPPEEACSTTGPTEPQIA